MLVFVATFERKDIGLRRQKQGRVKVTRPVLISRSRLIESHQFWRIMHLMGAQYLIMQCIRGKRIFPGNLQPKAFPVRRIGQTAAHAACLPSMREATQW